MAILKNKTQDNFTIVSNTITHDKRLSMKDRGVMLTLLSLPDGWKFSVAGLCAISADGKDAVRASLKKLESFGYLVRTSSRNDNGQFISEIEVFPDPATPQDVVECNEKETQDNRGGFSATVNPTTRHRGGFTVTVNPPEYNTDNKKLLNDIDSLYNTVRPNSDIYNIITLIGVSEADAKKLLDRAGGDAEKVIEKYNIAINREKPINDLVAWLMWAIKSDEAPPLQIHSDTTKEKSSAPNALFNNCPSREYDTEELERWLLITNDNV